jgi:hypothetical protein
MEGNSEGLDDGIILGTIEGATELVDKGHVRAPYRGLVVHTSDGQLAPHM